MCNRTRHGVIRGREVTGGHVISRMAAIFDSMSLFGFGFRDVIAAKEGPILLSSISKEFFSSFRTVKMVFSYSYYPDLIEKSVSKHPSLWRLIRVFTLIPHI